ncbi:hypothetical protein LJC07_03995 [Christensenellaceae bacterium OttesenSCG-928-L17]|nr:hypothetical protein [Christensenellaceae bacterium OttesenSCG-928-L17]
MPNRVIKESIKRSPQIDSLTWFEEVVFFRLIVTVDDYGCTDGRIVVLKNDLFPTKETVTKKAVEDAISKLSAVGLIRKYTVNGLPYLFLPTWEKHQRIRNQHRKYPEPPLDGNLTADCGQTSASCMSESESNPNPIQSESKREAQAPPRTPRGDYNWVKLTDAEYERLISEFGEEEVKYRIAYVDESAQSTGNKNKWKTDAAYSQYALSDGMGTANAQMNWASTDPTTLYNQIMSLSAPATVSYSMPDYDSVLSNYQSMLRPGLDLAISNRQKQTQTNRANIDTDAASRGMGRSTWVSDVKSREMNAEASDVASLEAQVLAQALEAAQAEMLQHQANQFAADQYNAQIQNSLSQSALSNALGLATTNQSASRSSGGSGGSSKSSGTLAGLTGMSGSERQTLDDYLAPLTHEQQFQALYGPMSSAVIEASQATAEELAAAKKKYTYGYVPSK